MSKHQAVRAIRSEIARLNQEIDLKIIRGVSYATESRRHRMLLPQLRRLTGRHIFSPFGLLSIFS